MSGKSLEAEINEAQENRVDQVYADALLKSMGEAQWKALGEKERQARILNSNHEHTICTRKNGNQVLS